MTRRRKRFVIVAVIIFLGLIAMFVRPRHEIRIEVVGTPGQSIAASFEVDGKRHEESRQLPTAFSFQARDISFVMVSESSRYESNLIVKAYIGDKHILSCRGHNGVKGNVTVPRLLGLGGNNTGIGIGRPDELMSLGKEWNGRSPDEQQLNRLAIENVVVVNVRANSEQNARLEEHTVLIEGNRIIQVAPTDEVDVEQGVKRIDGSSKYLVPGFWDMHAHVHWHDDDSEKVVLPLMFANGVTGLRDMSSDNDPPLKTLHEIRRLRLSIERGEVRGPRLMALCRKIDGERKSSFLRRMSIAPHDEAEGRMAAKLAHLEGVDFVKVYSGLPRSAFFGLMDEANKLGLPVAGHLPQSVTPMEASNAGMRSIEHARFPALACGPDYEEWRSAYADYVDGNTAKSPDVLYRNHQLSLVAGFDESLCIKILDTFAKNGTHLCPTHTTRKMEAFASDPDYRADPRRKYIASRRLKAWDHDLNRKANLPTEVAAHFKAFFQLGLRVTGLAHRRGVRILAGTDGYDTHVFPGFSYHDELQHLQQAGLSSLDVLKTATILPAEFLDKAESFGSVDVNKVADLVILDSDPLSDIRNTRTIHAVIFDGQVYQRDVLQAMLRGVEEHVTRSTVQVGR